MECLSIKELIEKRANLPFGRGINDAWIAEIVSKNLDRAYLVTTDNFSNLYKSSSKNAKRTLLETYYVSGIFDLSTPLASTSVRLMLLILDKEKQEKVFSGNYFGKLFHNQSSNDKSLDGNCLPLDNLPLQYNEYCKKIEARINNRVSFSDGDDYSFNEFDSAQIDIDRLWPQCYSKEILSIYDYLRTEKTIRLSDLATIIRPRLVIGEEAKVLRGTDFQYPLKQDQIKEGLRSNILLNKGDIIFKRGVANRLYLVLDDLNDKIFADVNDTIIRVKDLNMASYIMLYLQSETGKAVIRSLFSGGSIQRVSHRDIINIPIIIPKNSLDDYTKIFNLQCANPQNISDYNETISSLSKGKRIQSIEDVLNVELLKEAKLFKGEALHKMLEADLKEVNACYKAKAFKATLILCGSILEAVLIDWLSELDGIDYFESDLSVTDKKTKLSHKANLYDYINKIKKLKKPSWNEGAERSDNIRNNRNLVHAKLCLCKEEINDDLCEKVIGYLKYVLKTRGLNV